MKYKVNDIIINKDGYKRKILEVLTQVYITSPKDEFELAYNGFFLESELDKHGYTLYQEPKPKIELGSEESLGKTYWLINSRAEVTYTYWKSTYIDKFRLKTNNVFDTEEEAEARLKEILES